MSNIEKGTNYEVYIKNFLQNEDKISWLWKNIPEFELRKAKLLGDWNEYRLNRKELTTENPLIDTGCDVLLKSNEKYYVVQCKNYDNQNTVKICDLAGFYMTLCHYDLDGIVYYTSKLSKNLQLQKETDKVKFIRKPFECENLKIEQNYTKLIDYAYDYQIEAYENIKNAFQEKNRAILQLPCGLGKTLISMMVGLNYDQVIILSPLKQYCIQNLARFKSEDKYKDYNGLIIDSDETRDIKYISNFIKSNKKIILSVCYKSSDILFEVLDLLKNSIIIVDEFHNITKNDLLGLKENAMSNILFSDSKILFMSATPRIFQLDEEDDELNSEIFGEIEYIYNMGDAIRNNKICDYEVYVPDIFTNNSKFITDINDEVDIKNLDNNLVTKANFLMRAMLETGARKCILYARTQDESHSFKEIFTKLNKYFYVDMTIETILSQDKKSERERKIQTFTTFNGFSILINVEILNECIDIKECDSVYITYPSQSKIRNIQRICRANRKNSNNINKVSKIFLWTDEYNEMVDTISHLKEFDNSFMLEKVKILSLNNNDFQILNRTQHEKKYETLDNFIINVKHVLTWEQKFDLLVQYIKEHGNPPSLGSENSNIKKLAKWYQNQKASYEHKTKMMQYPKYTQIWQKFMTDYPQNFLNNEEKWLNKLNKVKKYVEDHNNAPSRYSKDPDEKELGLWFAMQKENCRRNIKMFAHENIIAIWKKFIEDHKKHFMTNIEVWHDRFDELNNYINEHGKAPVHKRNEKQSLGLWVQTQNKNYKQKTQIMSNPEFYNIWSDFLYKNSELFMTNEELWYANLLKLTGFINEFHKLPDKRSLEKNERSLYDWLSHQRQNLKKNTNIIRSNQFVKNDFEKFLCEYKDLF